MTSAGRRSRRWSRGALVGALLVTTACRSPSPSPPGEAGDAFSAGSAAPSACPPRAAAPNPLPGVTPAERTLAYWVARQRDPDEVVLSVEAIRAHDAAFAARDRRQPDTDALAPFDLLAAVDASRLAKEVESRLAFVRQRVDAGEYVAQGGKRPPPEPFAAGQPLPPLVAPERGGELRVALDLVPLRCAPTTASLVKVGDANEAFDRNLCSTLRPQEPVAVLATWPNGMRLVRSRAALGWVAADAPLSPPVPADRAEAVARGPRVRVRTATKLRGARGAFDVPPGTFLASAGEGTAHFATTDSFERSQPLADAATVRPLTRRALFEEAFAYLDTAYGWGGRGGGRDCSEFLASVLGAFGVDLPRHSGMQALAGTMTIDVSSVADEGQRLAIVDAAAERGIVLLSFPGHIMLYLGRTTEGRPMVMHAFAEYLERCAKPASGETLVQVDRVQVSDLALGAGTSRRSFLERLTRVTILGGTPGPALAGVAERRPPAPVERRGACREGEGAAEGVTMLVSPRHAHPGRPLRVVVASRRDLGSPELVLDDPDGTRTSLELHRTGGPPFGYWGELPSPRPGKWTARLGDGPSTFACADVEVHSRAGYRQAGGSDAWPVRRAWSAELEALYGVFVEQLFAYPFDDRTWKNLESILSVPDHNVLFGYHDADEEARLKLEPDCADLPYFLRAYFAWKLGLPFAYRQCTRGGHGRAPTCESRLHSNLDEHPDGRTATDKFLDFARSSIANGVHSGTGRAGPRDSSTDHYAVPLTREALAPGAVFADPYGHGYVVAGWLPQGLATHGMMMGADAQPDGTIGRRRFWRGTFLFTPDTTNAGAGFKRFRPLLARGGRVVAVANEQIATTFPELAPFSLEQYELDKDGWYDRVEALANPRPLAVADALEVLLSALYEQVKARVVSVQNGAGYLASHPGTIAMPKGHAVFETEGAWEDYSTPSRDMRLLIAIDTVAGFPDAVRRQPGRFGLPAPGPALDARIAELRERIAKRVGELAFEYPRSDGSPWKLTVADVIARAKALETAYNPNDCPELRWGAPESSDERATCKRQAPAGQRQQLEKNRSWFATRTRPPR